MSLAPARPRVELWWLKPAWIFCGSSLVVACLTLLVPASMFEENWSTPKYFGAQMFWYIVAAAGAFALGTFATRSLARIMEPRGRFQPDPGGAWDTVLLIFRVSVALTLVGYVAWGYSAAKHGVSAELLLGAMTGAKGATYELRESYLTTISGVTTMTQFGIPAVVLGVAIGFTRGWKRVRVLLLLVFVPALLRAVLNSERLAVIELVLPAVISTVAFRCLPAGRHKRLLSWAPIAGPVVVLLVFTAFEYSRSWTTYYSGGDKSLLQFTSDRLLGYYVTALNNSAYLWRTTAIPLRAPFFTMNFLWRFPVIGDFIHEIFFGLPLGIQGHYMSLLENGANPEFNNTGGILLPLIDFGVSFGLVYWILFGAMAQALYELFVRGSMPGLFLYPAIYPGLLEIPRIFYWGDARFFPAVCMLLLTCLLVNIRGRRLSVSGSAGRLTAT